MNIIHVKNSSSTCIGTAMRPGIMIIIGGIRYSIWVVVKIMVPFWVPILVRHLISRVPKKGP